MSFVHPAFAWVGLCLMAVPPLLHLLARRRYREVPWAAMVFLAAAHRQSRRRMRVEGWLLMGLRMLVIGLVGAALARPALPGSSAFARAVGEPRMDRVIILDDTLSMRAATPTGSAFETARAAALRLIDSFPPNDGIALITMSWPARAPIDRPTIDRVLLRQTLAELQPTAAVGDLSDALALAADAMSHGLAAPDHHAMYILSDMARTTWLAGEEQANPDAVTPTRDWLAALRRVAPPDQQFIINTGAGQRDNLAITSLSVQARPAQRRGLWLLDATVSNHGTRAADGLELAISSGAAAPQRVSIGALGAGQTRRVAVPLRVMRVGPQTITARLHEVTDVLALDNQRMLAIEATGQRALLLVTDQDHAVPESDPGFYVHAVFAPTDSAAAPFEPRRITVSEIPSTSLDGLAVVMLLGVPRMPAAQWQRLRHFVADGGGLMISLGPDLESGGDDGDWLPGRLLAPADPSGQAQSAIPLRVKEPQHAAIADTVAHRGGGLLETALTPLARWTPVLSDRSSAAQVLLTFANGEPALVVGLVGHGRVAWWTTTLDMSSGALPAKPDFVPLLHNLMGWLAAGDESRRNVLVGVEWKSAIPVTAGPAPLVHRPDGSEESAQASQTAPADERQSWTYARTDTPGKYTAADERWSEDFVVATNAAESDLAAMTESELRQRAGEALRYAESADELLRPAAQSPRRELSAALVVMLFALVLIESMLAAWFGRRA